MTTLAIPASAIVAVTPSVLSAGGNALDLSGVLLTTSARVPIGAVLAFSTADDVGTFFGPASTEETLSSNYFLGFDNSNVKPAHLLFAQYNTADVGAWLRGGSLAAMTLAQLQDLTGVLTVSLDGTPHTSGTIDLSGATSFSNAAEIITTALGTTGPAGASFTGVIATTTLTASSVTGVIEVGQEVRGAGVAPNTVISAQLTGTAGAAGTYTVSNSQTVGSEAMTTDMPTVTYDSVSHAFYVVSPTTGTSSTISYGSGTIAASIGLTQASGATVSQGAVTAVPGTMMDAVADATQDWASFATIFNPDESGNTNKLAFATWCNAQNNRFLYVAWDTDITPTESSNATTSLGNILKTNNTSGTAPIYSAANGPALASFLMGAIASLDFSETNGRATMAFRAQSGISPEITSRTVADNLAANGYNYYGIWGTANDTFDFLYPGTVSGDFAWIDSYVDQIWLNNQFQLALMVLLTNAKSIPYNQAGYTLIRAACQDVINQGLNFGAFRTGVTLSEQQKAIVNNSAGFRVDDVLTRQGYYLLVQDATPQVRAARGSPPCTFWYCDGGSVQQINLASILVQ